MGRCDLEELDSYEENTDGRLGGPKKRLGKKEEARIVLASNVCEWVLRTPIILEGQPFTFKNHEYLVDEYLLNERIEVNMKAAQTGFTVKALLKSIHKSLYLYPKGVLYLFPTAVDVTEFSKSRYSRLIEENPALKGSIRDTDAANLKAMGMGYFYFRGMRSRTGLKSIPVDCVVFDEYDEQIPHTTKESHEMTSPEMALERMSHSKFKHSIYLSTPTLPDFGIHALFKNTTQNHWFIRCGHCGKETCLELEVVRNAGDELRILRKLPDGRVIRACKYCGKEIFPSDGRWVKRICEKKGIPHGSYISQLNSYSIDPAELLAGYEVNVLRTRTPLHGKPNEQEFWNSKIGWPFVSAQDRLAKEKIRSCCGAHGIASYDMGPCAMGVDQNNGIHCVILTLRMGKPVILYLGIHKEWVELSQLMKAFAVSCCVVDALPEKRNARKFAMTHRGRVWLNYYDRNKKGSYSWNEGEYQVNVDRTESLDESQLWLANEEVVLPKEDADITEKFVAHCHNVAKRRIEEKNGTIRYSYVSLGGEDHFRHAFNYCVVAAGRIRARNTSIDDVHIFKKLSTSEKDWDI